MTSFRFTSAKSIINETGAIKRIADICQQQGISRPLIVTDPGIVSIGLLEKLEQALLSANMPYCCFTEIVADPPEAIVLAALEKAKSENVDGVIGFGGGSSMDSAKLVALLAKSGESLKAIYGVEQAKGQRLPLIQIPTTAGTGSEVTAVAIVTTGETTKAGVVAPQLLPDVAVLDAELTLGLPPHITAATGIDAMVHAIEAYTSAIKKNPYSDMLAREALKLMANNIEQATFNGSDLKARQGMLFGACLAGQAFANAPVAAVHALAYPLGGHYHIPHGLSNSLVLPHVLRFNANSAAPLYAELADVILADKATGDAQAKTQQLIDYLEQLIAKLNIPNRLRDMKVPESDLPMLAKDTITFQQRLLVNNPREVTEVDALAIYQAAF